MEKALAILRVGLVLAAAASGATGGIILSLRCFGRHLGFPVGAFLGGVFTLLASMMTGYAVAGNLEGLLGKNVGVPFGLLLGCFAGAFAMNTLAGAAGAALVKAFK